MNEYEDNNCIFVGASRMLGKRVEGGLREHDLSGVCVYVYDSLEIWKNEYIRNQALAYLFFVILIYAEIFFIFIFLSLVTFLTLHPSFLPCYIYHFAYIFHSFIHINDIMQR